MEIFNHVTVGGGIVGASVAYHLTCKVAGTVLLLERNERVSAAPSWAAGLVLQAPTKFSKTPLAKLTTNTISVLEEELGESVGYHNVGNFCIAASEDHTAEMDAMAGDASKTRKAPA